MKSYIFWAASIALSVVSAASFTNPLKARDGSDPHIVYTGGYYYLTTTTWNDLQITRSKTLGGLKTGERKVVWTDSDPARCCWVWAPELHYFDDRWYLYYSSGHSQNVEGQRARVLQGGSSPWDSYTYAGQLLANDWSIDGTVLRFPNQNYFVWSCFPRPQHQSLCIAPMTSPTTIGAYTVLSEPTLPWERVGNSVNPGPVNEGAAAMYHNGTTYLAYSASYCGTASYQIGLLTYKGSGDPMLQSSWTKTGPVFSSANGHYGTGHNGFFLSPDETEIWNVYHATKAPNGSCGGDRYTMAKVMQWNADGTPDFGRADPLSAVLAGPSGEPA